IVGLKYFNVFGPNEYHKKEMRSLVNKAVEQIRETGNLRLFKSHNPDYADGEFGRDFIYVKDAVDMTIYFMESSVGGLFNIGSGRMTTWNELAGAIIDALGQPPSIEYIEMPESIRGQYQYYTKANLAR
ncbi:NAD-dependent epimerase/dehydratase family protein, partial [Vibrio parahaemolyticus]|uniref:NAD-dependent epimerase/dehydratase family protein n=1 Tax=Vibrio parahaemolyticus TaxID=670 RepID=UPI00146E862C